MNEIARGNNHAPVLDYCRELVERGEKKNTRLEVYRDRETPDVIVPKIGIGAKYCVGPNKSGRPSLIRIGK